MRNILIVGASGHSKMIVDSILKTMSYNVVGYVDSYKTTGDIVYGHKILGSLKNLADLKIEYDIYGIIIGIGDNHLRKELKNKIDRLLLNLKYISVVHPSAILANDVAVPKGTIIMAGAVVNANAKLGEFCILNTKSSLGHDATMGSFSSLASGVTVGGNVKIGYSSAICIGATIIQNISIGENTVIGAGSLVIENVGDFKQAFGVPITNIKNRNSDSKYLG